MHYDSAFCIIFANMVLIGRPLLARLTAFKPGHTSNTMFAKIMQNAES